MPQRSLNQSKLADRLKERLTDLAPDLLKQLNIGASVTYHANGELVRELPDGQRFVIRSADGGRPEERVREVLSAAEQSRIQAFVDTFAAVAEARAFGIDISQTVRNALLSPEERWRRANAAIARTRQLSGSAKRANVKTKSERG